MNTTEAFLDALTQPQIKTKYPDSTIRTWRSRANREILSLDFMVEFLLENNYHLEQIMKWKKPGADNGTLNGKSNHTNRGTHDNDESANDKTELGKKLYSVRKEMNHELFSQWFGWCKAEYAKDYPARKTGLTNAVFSQMTYGRYISKENVNFAIKTLKEGKRMLTEYEERIRKELEAI